MIKGIYYTDLVTPHPPGLVILSGTPDHLGAVMDENIPNRY